MKTWNVPWDSKRLWTERESPVTANLPRSQPFTFSASLATILLRHPDWQHISLKIRPREPGSRRRETWDSRHFRFVNLFASQLFNVIDDTSCFFVVMNRRRSYWGTSHQRFKKAPGWGKHEGLSSLTKPSWLCDCLAKGDAQHLDVTFCRQENSVEDITIRFQDPSQLLEQVGQNGKTMILKQQTIQRKHCFCLYGDENINIHHFWCVSLVSEVEIKDQTGDSAPRNEGDSEPRSEQMNTAEAEAPREEIRETREAETKLEDEIRKSSSTKEEDSSVVMYLHHLNQCFTTQSAPTILEQKENSLHSSRVVLWCTLLHLHLWIDVRRFCLMIRLMWGSSNHRFCAFWCWFLRTGHTKKFYWEWVQSKIQVFANEVLPSKHGRKIMKHIYHFVSNCPKMMGIVLISLYFIGVFTSEAEAECDESKKCIMGASCHLRWSTSMAQTLIACRRMFLRAKGAQARDQVTI